MKSFYTLAVCLGALFDAATALPPETQGQQPGKFAAAPPVGSNPIDRKGWTVECSSQAENYPCGNAIDGDKTTFWQTPYGTTNTPPPHTITIDMKQTQYVSGLQITPPQDSNVRNWIGRHEVYLSSDGTNWGSPVAIGTYWGDKYPKITNFETRPARYLRFVALSNVENDYPWIAIADFIVYNALKYSPPKAGLGRWGVTLDFPVIPVAGAVEPLSGKVVVWSAYRYDAFQGTAPRGGFTLTSIWDPKANVISNYNVTNNHHDMFCPGISMDGDGQIIVTGGNDAKKTTILDPDGNWVPGPDMVIARGYQSSATTSDGRVFTIGGSWSGPRGGKNGEIYDPKAKTWTYLPKALVAPMLTKDKEGVYKADNHGWLFGWKKGSVFQAGPSTAMNWYYTTRGTQGDTKAAGTRRKNGRIDPDSMNGNAVMFDAVNGKILTYGGATSYVDAPGTAHAHVLTIDEPGAIAQTALVGTNGDGIHPRVFHTSVVLPDGNVFITGGQQHSNPFTDTTAQLEPEMFVSASNTFIKQQPNTIPRTYHSMSLLLPDATVFNGGGGLCGSCKSNHFDAQIFTPNYLYDSDGNLATRPKISAISATTAKVGSTITVTTNGAIKSASLIRYGTATHTVNTDQRRIPLTLTGVGTNKYTFKIPSDSGIALPGYWMLFALNSAGVPSVASTIKVTI
ncbi:sialidase-1 [Fusarium oxysporum f. sp. pisi HDV247]|uniref:Sialidase-1 n=1 Tax=Fusarium oxysporum f. sp. pisi HDV247 TaxID=1080344 RepID=W9N966_FUSOX|nr:sialidase-1 [Fusarium oxysporum f. sp. pisi HDV247]